MTFSRPIDRDFAQVSLRCPLGDGYLAAVDAGSFGHRRVCPNCGIVVVMPRVALAKAMSHLARASRARRRAAS
jgi:hypothetical protein